MKIKIISKVRFILFLLFGLCFFQITSLKAEDLSSMQDRLDRIERSINMLQADLYRNKSSNNRNSSPSSSPTTTDQATYNAFDDRLTGIETTLQTLTEQIERANHDVMILNGRFDRMQNDNEFRFKQLEGKSSSEQIKSDSNLSTNNEKNTGSLGASAGTLVHRSGNESSTESSSPSTKSPKESYEAAFKLLTSNDYPGATVAFQNFIAQYPKDPLSGNATFWLGKIFYSNKKYDQAAVNFMDVYSKYPKSPKAADGLLGVSQAFDKLGKKKEACAALIHLLNDIPDISPDLKKQALAEKHQQKC